MRKITILIFLALPVMAADLPKEIPTIRKAAERNGIKYGSNDWFLLLAIRLAENGTKYQFGIIDKRYEYNLDKQAASCACTIRNQHKRSGIDKVNEKYLISLAKRYCPVGAANDPKGLNKYWLKNVQYWFKELKNENSM